MSNENNENLEGSQENQKKIGSAEKDPKTSGPSEKLRVEALEETDTENTDKEPSLILFFDPSNRYIVATSP